MGKDNPVFCILPCGRIHDLFHKRLLFCGEGGGKRVFRAVRFPVPERVAVKTQKRGAAETEETVGFALRSAAAFDVTFRVAEKLMVAANPDERTRGASVFRIQFPNGVQQSVDGETAADVAAEENEIAFSRAEKISFCFSGTNCRSAVKRKLKRSFFSSGAVNV